MVEKLVAVSQSPRVTWVCSLAGCSHICLSDVLGANYPQAAGVVPRHR